MDRRRGGGPNNGDVRVVDDREPKTPTPPPAKPMAPGPLQAGRPPDPTSPFIDDPRFGHWEKVPPPPPYTGSAPPPLQPQYRPFPDGSPLKVGPSTAMYTPGKSWIGDIDPPAFQHQEEYRFKLAGEQATTMTHTVFEDGRWQQERWVQNVYEYQRNTADGLSGDIGLKGIDGEDGDLGGLAPSRTSTTPGNRCLCPRSPYCRPITPTPPTTCPTAVAARSISSAASPRGVRACHLAPLS